MNAKRKGNKGEHAFSHYLQENGIKAYRNPMSGGSVWKGDIGNDLDFCFEVKTVKRINLQEAWRQVKRDSGLASNTPVLAIRFDNMPENNWLMVMSSDDWLEAIKTPKVEVRGIAGDDWARKNAIARLKTAANEVLKHI